MLYGPYSMVIQFGWFETFLLNNSFLTHLFNLKPLFIPLNNLR